MDIIRQFFFNQCTHRRNNGIGIVPFDKQKVFAVFVECYRFAFINLMRVHDDFALCRLSENLFQLHDFKAARMDNIL